MSPQEDATLPEIVLVGGGHSHIQVLEHFATISPAACRLTLLTDLPTSIYSGMVPGQVAGQYERSDLEIDVAALARRIGARLVLARATGVDAKHRRILLQDAEPVPYDLASFDIGSTVSGLEIPGVREHALAVRPIGTFIHKMERITGSVPAAQPLRVIVVGGGAGGVELAFAVRERLRRAGAEGARVELLEGSDRILSGYPESLARRVHRRGAERGVVFRCDQQVAGVEPEAVLLAGGERIPCQALIWAAGAASHPVFRSSGLPTDDRGFVRVRSTLQVEGHDDLFAAGDCATLIDHPSTPKAGVYAVRQGPIITANLLASLAGGSLRSYVPQRDFLTLMNLGDGHAAGAKWGWSFEGSWVMRWKDRIDRRFVRRFQALAAAA